MAPRKKPLLVYDGDCGFCRRWILRWRAVTGDRVEYVPADEAIEAVRLEEPDGSVRRGAEAVFRTLSLVPGRGMGLWAYRKVPGFAAASEAAYRFIAARRPLFSRLTALLWGDSLEPPSYSRVSRIFLAALGVIYFAAFVSLGVQILGLVGSDGILPAGRYLETVAGHAGRERYWYAPTLFWLGSSDAALRAACGAGAFLSLFLVVGAAPAPVAALLWLLYLSLTVVSQTFLGYQWDNLLLETGFLAIFLGREPGRGVLWLNRWLLFRLVFFSGLVKLLSGDPAWRSLAALTYHYQTQPLPTWIAWYAHRLPAGLQRFCAAAMFFIELAVPFLIFAPRRPRMAAGAVLCAFMALIFLTGNYCFFNLLGAALCITLLDDAALGAPSRPSVSPSCAGRILHGALAALVLAVSGADIWGTLARRLPAPLAGLYGAAAPFRSINGYGLFAVMTTVRGEIVVEGSLDGKTWKAYEFKWKPGDLRRRPAFVAPHQPRLDWQMWFAALGGYEQNPWFTNFLARLLQGKPAVLALLAGNPFPEKPPRYVRALYYEYRFSDPAQRRADGSWWRRELKGLYCPVLSLRPA